MFLLYSRCFSIWGCHSLVLHFWPLRDTLRGLGGGAEQGGIGPEDCSADVREWLSDPFRLARWWRWRRLRWAAIDREHDWGSEGGAADASAAPAQPAAATGPTWTACWLTQTRSLLEWSVLRKKEQRLLF